MLYSKINNTDIVASKIVMGTDGFGTEMPDKLCFDMLDRFLNAGGNIIDTASFYADWHNMGKSMSEKTIGKWLTSRKNREKVIISTKGGHPRLETMEISRLSKAEIFDDFENSLINLQTDYIDIYWLHKDDIRIAPEELITIMNEVLQTGKARYIAASNWSYDRLKQANDYAKKNGMQPFIAGQIQHSIAKVNAEAVGDDICAMTDVEYEKYCSDNLNLFAFSSQAKGFFAIMDSVGLGGVPEHVKKEFLNDYNLSLYKKLKNLSVEMNTSISSLLLYALVTDKKLNTFAQIGPRKIEFLEDSLKIADINGDISLGE